MPNSLKDIQDEIDSIKQKLTEIGNMRPGNLNRQFRKPKEKQGAYYQLNYTHKNKTRTDYVRVGMVDIIASELDEYKKFRGLTERWVELSIQASKMSIK
jgi:hypothetical protein